MQDPKLLNPQNDPDNSMRLILCAICNKTFKLRIQLKRHMMQVHNKPSGKI